MDFHSMKRKDLQALCKKHDLFANGTNVEIADRLASHLKKKSVLEEPKSKSKKVKIGNQDQLNQDLGQSNQIDVVVPARVTTRSKRGGEEHAVDTVPKKKLKVVDEKSKANQEVSVRVTRRGVTVLPKVSGKRPSPENVVSEAKEEVGGGRVTRRGVKDINKEGGEKVGSESEKEVGVGGRVTRRGVKKGPQIVNLGENVDTESKGSAGTGVETSRSLRSREVVKTGVGANLAKKASSPRETTRAAKADRNNEVEVGNINVSRVGTRQTRARKNDNKEDDAVLPVVYVAVAENETQQATRRQTRKSVAPTNLLPEKTSRASRQKATTDEQKKGTVSSGKSDGQNGDKAGNISATETSTRQTRARKRGSNESDAPLIRENDIIADAETQVATRTSKRKPIASSNVAVKSQKVSSSSDLVTDVASEQNWNKELGVQMPRGAAKKLTKVSGKKASSVTKLADNVDEERSVQTTRTLRNRDVLPSGVDVNIMKKASSPKETARALKMVQKNDSEVGNFVVTEINSRSTRARKGANKEGGAAGNVVCAQNVIQKTTSRSRRSPVAPTNLLAEKSPRSNRQGPAADEQKKGTVESRNSDEQNEDGVGNIAVTGTNTRQTRARTRGSEDGDVSLAVKKVSVVETGSQQVSRSSKKKSGAEINLMVENPTSSSTVDLVKNAESDGNGNGDIMVGFTGSVAEESIKVDGQKGSRVSVLEKNVGSTPVAVENIVLAETGTPQATRSLKRKSPAVSITSTRQTRSRKRGNAGGNTSLPVKTPNFSETGTLHETNISKRKSTAPTTLVAEMRSEEGDTRLEGENVIGAKNINLQGTQCQSVASTSAVTEESSRQNKQPLEVLKVSDDSHAVTVDGTSLEGNLKSTDECAQLKMNAGDKLESVVLANNDDDGAILFEMIHDKEKIEPIQICGGASNLNVVNEGLEDVGDIAEDVAVSEKMGSLLEEASDQVKEKHVDRAEVLIQSAPSDASPETQFTDFVLDREISQQTNSTTFRNSSDGSSIIDLEDVAKLSTENRQEIFVGSSTLEDKQEDFEDTRQEINVESTVPDRQTDSECNLELLNANDPSEEIITKEVVPHSDNEYRMLITSCSEEKRQEDGQEDPEGNLEQLNASDPSDDVNANDPSEEIITKEDVPHSDNEYRMLITSCSEEKRQEDGQEDPEGNLEQLNASDPSDDVNANDPSEEIITKEDVPHSDNEYRMLITSCSEEKRQEDGQEDPEGNLEQLNASDPSDDVKTKEDTDGEDRMLVTSCSQEKRQEIILESTVEYTQEDPECKEQLNASDRLDDTITKEGTEGEDRMLITSCSEEESKVITVEDGQEGPEGSLEKLNVSDPSDDIITKEDTEGEDMMLITPCSHDVVVEHDEKEMCVSGSRQSVEEIPILEQEVCDADKMIQEGDAAIVKHLGHDSVEKRDMGHAPIVDTVEHGGDAGRGVDLEEYTDVNNHTTDRMDQLEHLTDSEEEWTFPDRIVDQKEDIGNAEETVSTSPQNSKEDGYQENLLMQNIMDRKEDFGNAEGTVSTSPQDMEEVGHQENHMMQNVIGADDCCVLEKPVYHATDVTNKVNLDPGSVEDSMLTVTVDSKEEVEKDIANAEGSLGISEQDIQEVGYQEKHMMQNTNEADMVEVGHQENHMNQIVNGTDDCCVLEKPEEIAVDHSTDVTNKVNLDPGSEEDSMLTDTVDCKEEVEKGIANAEGSLGISEQDMEEVGYQEKHMMQNTNDSDDCCILEKPTETVDDHAGDVMDEVNLDPGSEEESMFPDTTVDRKADVEEDVASVKGSLGSSEQVTDKRNYQETHMVQNTEDTDEFCDSVLDTKEACEVQNENTCVYNQCQPGIGNSGEAFSQTVMGSEYGFDIPVANEGNKDDVKPAYRTVGYDGNLFIGANTVNKDASSNQNIISGEYSEASWTAEEFPGDRVEDTSVPSIPPNTQQGDDLFYLNMPPGEVFDKQETNEIFQEVQEDTELVENLATDEETEALQSPGSKTLAGCASPKEEYLRCPPVLASKEHIRANAGLLRGLHSEHIYTHSVGDENTSSFPEKPREIVVHHAGDNKRVSQASLCFSLEEQMVEDVIDQDLGDSENHLVPQAEDAVDCNVEVRVGLGEEEKHMMHLSGMDYPSTEPCEGKESAYVGPSNFEDYSEAAVGSSLCSTDLPQENVVNSKGDMESKDETFGYFSDLEMSMFDDEGTKDAAFVQSRTSGEFWGATGTSGPVCDDRVDASNKLGHKD